MVYTGLHTTCSFRHPLWVLERNLPSLPLPNPYGGDYYISNTATLPNFLWHYPNLGHLTTTHGALPLHLLCCFLPSHPTY